MRGRRSAPKVLLVVAIATLVVSIVGMIGSVLLNVFVFDRYNAYGEVPIPGTAYLRLPAGEVTIAFRTRVAGSPGEAGLPIPDLGISIDPPTGAAKPEVTESIGSTTTVNNDVRRRLWIAHIPADGTYRIATDGKVSAFIDPRLAFGHASTMGWLLGLFAVLILVAVVDLVISVVWLIRRSSQPAIELPGPIDFAGLDTSAPDDVDDLDGDAEPRVVHSPAPECRTPLSYEPTDNGVRIEQLKTLAALRDSGALTEKEFEAEKRRVLRGG
jgi:hypothetical protein